MVSIHAPARGATAHGDSSHAAIDEVSIHAPARGATSPQPSATMPLRTFQSTPPRGGRRDAARELRSAAHQRFNPRPRAGGDAIDVSAMMSMRCFNPRPRARGDRQLSHRRSRLQLFQSTPPRGGRRGSPFRVAAVRRVSIHAPARGATRDRRRRCRSIMPFQSTPPREGRLDQPRSIVAGIRQFQSTPPREGRRPMTADASQLLNGFNPRPCARGDSHERQCCRLATMFQSTPPREGRRCEHGAIDRSSDVSIHAPARGATLRSAIVGMQASRVSIHAPARGATVPSDVLIASMRVFQSTPPREGRPGRRRDWRRRSSGFNPRPCARGDSPSISDCVVERNPYCRANLSTQGPRVDLVR